MKLENIIAAALITPMLLGIGGLAYAFVYDIDPVHLEKEYELERSYFGRTNSDWNAEFPDFASWVDERGDAVDRFHGKIYEIARDVGQEQADMWGMYSNMFMGSADSHERGDRD